MMNIDEYIRVSSLAEAVDIISSTEGACVLGGCGYLRMGKRHITKAVDLSALELRYITETEKTIELGAMTTLRDIETSPLLAKYYSGSLPDCVSVIVGTQLRNTLTIGGTVAGKYPFSDILPVLIVLDAEIHVAGMGHIPLEEFMEQKHLKGVIEKISIPKTDIKARFESVRNSATDYAMINCAVSYDGQECRIAVGARPQKAVRVRTAEKYINENGITPDTAEKAGRLASAELIFGDNMRASASYREAVCPVLVKRALMAAAG